MMSEKEDFRKKYKDIRSSIDQNKRENENQEIFSRFIELDAYKKAHTVFIYVSFGDEADTHRIIKKALEDKKYVTVPVCNKESHTLSPVLIEDMFCLEEGAYGILEPKLESFYNVVEKSSIDLAVVPGLCFSEDGSRIGYGGGYYDRFLEDFKGISVGLAFLDCIADSVPTEENDRRVDMVISAGKER